MIIAVGFKIDNERAIQFRKWANQIVKDFTIKGWVMDDERLKNTLEFLSNKFKENQIILFTCTNREKEVLDKLNKNYKIITLE